jgi:hypothetical protein
MAPATATGFDPGKNALHLSRISLSLGNVTISYIFCSFIAFHVHPRFWQVACSKMTRDENMGRFPVVGNVALLADTVLNY